MSIRMLPGGLDYVEVERVITACEEDLRTIERERCLLVRRRLRASERLPMTQYQRARLLGLRAEVTYALNDEVGALRLADAAISLATREAVTPEREVSQLRLQGEMQRMRGHILRRAGDFVEAAEAYGRSSGLLLRVATATGWVSTSALLDALSRCVGLEMNLGREEDALFHLEMVQTAQMHSKLLEQGIHKGKLEIATQEWMWALALQRKGVRELIVGIHPLQESGALLEALRHATSAASAYAAFGEGASAARIAWVKLEILLDLMELKPGPLQQTEWANVANATLTQLEKHARQGKDKAGAAMGELSAARLYRLTREGYRHATTRIRAVLARRLEEDERDWVTICLGRVALGRELAVQATNAEAAGGPKKAALALAAREEARRELEAALALAVEHASPGVVWYAPLALQALGG